MFIFFCSVSAFSLVLFISEVYCWFSTIILSIVYLNVFFKCISIEFTIFFLLSIFPVRSIVFCCFNTETIPDHSFNGDDCSHLLSTMSYLDETRVGIWGWGYGGYVTAMVLGTQQEIYKCGISVSPITDYLFYSKYTKLITSVWSKHHANLQFQFEFR